MIESNADEGIERAMGSSDVKARQTRTMGPGSRTDAQPSPDPFIGTNRFAIESDTFPTADRRDVAHEFMAHVFAGFKALPPNDPDFRWGIEASRVGDVSFAYVHTTSSSFRLGSHPINSSSRLPPRLEDEGIFWIVQRGSADVQQGAVDKIHDAGAAMFSTVDVLGRGLVSGGLHVLGISVPSKALRRAIGHDRHLAPVALAKGEPLIALLSGYIESTRHLPADADPKLLRSIGTHLADLVALALGPTRDAAEQAKQGGLKSARLDAILHAIEANHANPDFGVADVAAQLKLSVRYVQDILHETGISFAERVLELRLQAACDLLSRAHITNRKVSDIAFSCGFNNLSYFHRAFRRRFGMTPAGARSY